MTSVLPVPGIEGLAPAEHEAVAQINALELRAFEAEGEPSDIRWEQAAWVAKALDEGMSTRGLAATWINPETGKSYSHAHVWRTARCVTLGLQHLRWNTAIWSDEVRKPDRIDKNAAGAHEGLELSEDDTEGDGWKLLLGDFRERLKGLPDGSVNLIVTDPPYPEENLPMWDDLGREAARLLVSGGVLFARSPHLHLPTVIGHLDKHLQYGWTYCEPLPGANARVVYRHIAAAWIPWLAFSNGAWPSGSLDWHPDMLTESPRAKARYVWEQKPQIATEIMATFTAPGHDVLDPFAGSGTYGEAALGVGCKWIGVELDPAGHAQATARLAALQ